MRSLLITAALVYTAGPAAASSIDNITSGEAVNSSVATVSCAACPPLQPKRKPSYVVPDLRRHGSRGAQGNPWRGEVGPHGSVAGRLAR